MSESRTRVWTFILYPESAPDDWVDILENLHIEWIMSPLHDKDRNPEPDEDNPYKKPHYHIVLSFSQVKSYKQVEEITSQVNGTIPIRVHNLRSMVRYLIHLDNPEKYQYNQADVHAFGGIDIKDLFACTVTESFDIIGQIEDYVDSNNITEYKDLARCIRQTHPEWVYVFRTFNTIIWRYVQSVHYSGK